MSGTESKLENLPADVLKAVLRILATQSCSSSIPTHLCAVASSSRLLHSLASADDLWMELFTHTFPTQLQQLLQKSSPVWWANKGWKYRFAALMTGRPFAAQVLHREMANCNEDFHLSYYDATVRLLRNTSLNHMYDDKEPLLFTARYLPMGRTLLSTTAVFERVSLARLRPPIPFSSSSNPYRIHKNTPYNIHKKLVSGQKLELQWKSHVHHPFGWWLATVDRVIRQPTEYSWGLLSLTFDQYPLGSIWRSAVTALPPVSPATTVKADTCRPRTSPPEVQDHHATTTKRHRPPALLVSSNINASTHNKNRTYRDKNHFNKALPVNGDGWLGYFGGMRLIDTADVDRDWRRYPVKDCEVRFTPAEQYYMDKRTCT